MAFHLHTYFVLTLKSGDKSRREPPPTLINVFASRIFSTRLTHHQTGNYPSLRLTLLTQSFSNLHTLSAMSAISYHSREPPAGTGGKCCSNARRVDAFDRNPLCEGFVGGIAGILSR
jgi:hypothetical protein